MREWPFRLRVRALGSFDLVRDGESMRFTSKTQQRPLDVLKFFESLGGRDVDAEAVMAALWPNADGAAAKSSFDSAMFCLRKLLNIEDPIEVTSGKLSLNKSLVWTDVWALERAGDFSCAVEVYRRALEVVSPRSREVGRSCPVSSLGGDQTTTPGRLFAGPARAA